MSYVHGEALVDTDTFSEIIKGCDAKMQEKALQYLAEAACPETAGQGCSTGMTIDIRMKDE